MVIVNLKETLNSARRLFALIEKKSGSEGTKRGEISTDLFVVAYKGTVTFHFACGKSILLSSSYLKSIDLFIEWVMVSNLTHARLRNATRLFSLYFRGNFLAERKK